jgi:hypothetical protein
MEKDLDSDNSKQNTMIVGKSLEEGMGPEGAKQSSGLSIDQETQSLLDDINADHGHVILSESKDKTQGDDPSLLTTAGITDEQMKQDFESRYKKRETTSPLVATKIVTHEGVKFEIRTEEGAMEEMGYNEYLRKVVTDMSFGRICAYELIDDILLKSENDLSVGGIILTTLAKADELDHCIHRLSILNGKEKGEIEYNIIRGVDINLMARYVQDILHCVEDIRYNSWTEAQELIHSAGKIDLIQRAEYVRKGMYKKSDAQRKAKSERAQKKRGDRDHKNRRSGRMSKTQARQAKVWDDDVDEDETWARVAQGKRARKGKQKVISDTEESTDTSSESSIPSPDEKVELIPQNETRKEQLAREAREKQKPMEVKKGADSKSRRLTGTIAKIANKPRARKTVVQKGRRSIKTTERESRSKRVAYHREETSSSSDTSDEPKKVAKDKEERKHLGWKAALKERKNIAWIKFIAPGIAISKPIEELDTLIDLNVAARVKNAVTKPFLYVEEGKTKIYQPEISGSYMFKVYSITYYAITMVGEKSRCIMFRDNRHELSDAIWLVGIIKNNRHRMEFTEEYHNWCKAGKDGRGSILKNSLMVNYNDTLEVWDADPDKQTMTLRSLLDGRCPHPGPPKLFVWEGQPILEYTNTEQDNSPRVYVSIDTVGDNAPLVEEQASAEDQNTGEIVVVPETPDANLDDGEYIQELETGESPVTWGDVINDYASRGVENVFRYGNNGGLNYTGGIQRPNPIQFLQSYLTRSNAFPEGSPEHYVDSAFLEHDYDYWTANLMASSPNEYLQGLADADKELVDRLSDAKASTVPEAHAARILFSSLPKFRTLLDSTVEVEPNWYGKVVTGSGEVIIPNMGVDEFNEIFGFKPAQSGILSEYFKRGEVIQLKPKGGRTIMLQVNSQILCIDEDSWNSKRLYGCTRSGRLVREFDEACMYNGILKGFIGLKGGSDSKEDKDFNGVIEEVGKYDVPSKFSDYNVNGALNSAYDQECKFSLIQQNSIGYQKANYIPGSLSSRAIAMESWMTYNNADVDSTRDSIADLIGYVVYQKRVSNALAFTTGVLNRSVCAYYMNVRTVTTANNGADTINAAAAIPTNTTWKFLPAGKRLMQGWGVQMEVNSVAINYLSSIAPGGIANRVWNDGGRQDMQIPPWWGISLIDGVPRIENFLKNSTYGGVKKVSLFALALNIWIKVFSLQMLRKAGYNGEWTFTHGCNVNEWGGKDYVPTQIGGFLPDDQSVNTDPNFNGHILVIDEFDFVKYIMPNYDGWEGWAMLRPRFSNIMNINRPGAPDYIQPVLDEQQQHAFELLVLTHLSHPIRRWHFEEGVNNKAGIPYHNLIRIELARNILVVHPGVRDPGQPSGLKTPQGTDLVWATDADFTVPASNPNLLDEWDYTDANDTTDPDTYLNWCSHYFKYLITVEEWTAAYVWVSAMCFGTFQPRWMNSTNGAPYWSLASNYGNTFPRWPDGVSMNKTKVTGIPQYDVRISWMWTSQLMVPVVNETTEKIQTLSVLRSEYMHLDMQRMATVTTNAFDAVSNMNGVGVGPNIDYTAGSLVAYSEQYMNRWFWRRSNYKDVEVASLYACRGIGAKGYESLYHLTRATGDDAWLGSSVDTFAAITGISSWNSDSTFFSRVDPMELVSAKDAQPISGKFTYDRYGGIETRPFVPRWTVQASEWSKDIRLAQAIAGGRYGLWGYKLYPGNRPEWDAWMFALHRTFIQSVPEGQIGMNVTTATGINVFRELNVRCNITVYQNVNSSGTPYLPKFEAAMLAMTLDVDSVRWGTPVAFTALDVRNVCAGLAVGWIENNKQVVEYLLSANKMIGPMPLQSTLRSTYWAEAKIKIEEESGDDLKPGGETKLDPTDRGEDMKKGEAPDGGDGTN